MYYRCNGLTKSRPIRSTEEVVQELIDAISLHVPSSINRFFKVLDCGICSSILIEPVTLPCGHTFCKKCVSDSRDAEPLFSGESSNFNCEECKFSYVPYNLKTNVVISTLIEKWFPEAYNAAVLRKEATDILNEDPVEAVAKLKKAIKLDPLDHCSASVLSQTLLKHGHTKESLSYADLAIKINPKCGKNYFSKAVTLLRLGRGEDAVISYFHCLHLGYKITDVKKEILKRVKILCNFQRSPEKLNKLYERFMREIGIINTSRYCESNVRSVTSENLDKRDLECILCMRLLWEPVTTPCGHMYCRKCLDRSLDHQIYCPLCKTSLQEYLSERRKAITELVELAIQNLSPGDAADRKKAYEEELITLKRAGTESMQDVPLFICTIAFPTIRCPLHIFEPRYRLMTRQCIESGSKMFGMCYQLPDSETRLIYGTMLMIRDMQFLPDGRSIVDTVGGRRFKVLEINQRDGYHTGTIEYINDLPVDSISEETNDLKNLHDYIYHVSGEWFNNLPKDTQDRIRLHFGPRPSNDHLTEDEPNGPAWVWWLTAILPLEPQTQMTLLGMTSLRKRLEVLQRAFDFLQANQSN